ncbi:UNVERIFIED_CONTAM: hypothetical protein FKN15_033240 [Acipenser sinensis]
MKATVNDEGSLENSSLTKSQKNFSSPNNNAARSSPALLRRQEVTEEEAERFIQQVNHAAVTIQRWYRRHAHRRHTSEASLRRLLSTKKQEREQRAEEGKTQEGQKRKEEDRKRIREEKAQQARRAAIRELQQKRAQRAAETQRMAEQEIEALKQSGKVGRRKPARPSPSSKGSTAGRDTGKGRNTDSSVNVTADLDDISNLRSGSPTDSPGRGSQGSQEVLQRGMSVEGQLQRAPSSRAQSKTTLNELLDTLKLLEEDPERLPEPQSYRKEKYSWIDEDPFERLPVPYREGLSEVEKKELHGFHGHHRYQYNKHINIMKATVNDEGSLENSSLTKSQKNFSSPNNNAARSSPALLRRQEVTEEEAERFIQQVNHAAVTIQRWYRRHAHRRHTSEASLRRLLSTKKQEREQRAEEGKTQEGQKRKEEDRKRIREEKAQQARRAAIRELQQKRAQRAAETQRMAEQEIEALKQSGKVGRRKPARPSPSSKGSTADRDTGKGRNTDSSVNVTADLDDISNLRSGSPTDSPGRGSQGSQEVLQRGMSVEEQLQRAPSSRAQSKTTLNELLDTLKLLEEDPERLPEPQSYRKEKYSWIDEEGDSNSLTADNLELLGKMNQPPALPDGGALLSEAKLKSIMSFLDEMEKSEQERPRSVTSGSHREAQQRELTVRHIKETEKELNRNFQLQKDQYEATIQRHLAFIDQLIDDKKALSDRCEGVVSELKQVDQKYTKKIAHMQEQHDLEIKKLKELMSATEKIRREKWIDEKTKKIKEITVKGLEPEIQKLISKHKQELKKLRAVHEAELMQADERAAQRYVRQSEEMREQLEREKEEQCQRERELARQRYEKQLQEEEQALQQQRRRLYSEVAEEKERGSQLAARQRAELDELRKNLEDNSLVAGRALREEFERTREEQERRHQAEVKALKERLDIEKQAWEENYMKKEAQQRELTVRHIKETEKELNRNFQLQKDQYEATIQRHLAFIDQLIDDKKALSDRCEGVVSELKQVDQKYTKKIAHMQEQHDLEIKKLKELMSATEKIRREKWIDEKTKKIKEITVKGLEPEIQKLISKHKQELKKLRAVHEAELMQADERAAQRYVRQSEEMREQLEREKEEQCQRERELARQRYEKQLQEEEQALQQQRRRLYSEVAEEKERESQLAARYEKQLQEEEQALQQQRRRLYSEVAEEKERGSQLAARQRAELDELRKNLEDNSLVAGRALREEFERTREEQERRHQAEVKALKERLDIEKQAWEENYMKKEVREAAAGGGAGATAAEEETVQRGGCHLGVPGQNRTGVPEVEAGCSSAYPTCNPAVPLPRADVACLQRRRLYSEVAEEKERESQLAARQRMELDELRKHLEDNSLVAGRALREEFERTREEQERRHQAEVKALKERLDIEKQAWEENYMKKEEAWLLSRERELKEELRRGRDKEIELVIQRLEEETSRARDECERASENRVKRVREKYETELREMERSERSLQERHSELKGRLSQAEGEAVRLQGLLRQKEQEVQDMTQAALKRADHLEALLEQQRKQLLGKPACLPANNHYLWREEKMKQGFFSKKLLWVFLLCLVFLALFFYSSHCHKDG